MKKTGIIRYLTAFVLIAVLLLPTSVTVLAGEPYIVEQDGFVYEVWTDGSNELHSVFVKEYKGTATEVEMPTPKSLTINGKTYPAIVGTGYMVGDGTNPVFKPNQVTKVAIPSGYEAISSSAFNGCTALTEVAIAGSVGYIGDNAFANCPNLTNYYIETNAGLSFGDPRIGQSSDGTLNPNQVYVYTKTGNDNITSYVNNANSRSSSDKDIIIIYESNPYSRSTVKPGSGSTPGSSSSEQKGKDGTALGAGASESVAEKFLLNYGAESDPAGSVFSALQLKASKVTKTGVKLTWKKAPGAVRFAVFGNKCGKGNRYVKLTNTNATSITFTKVGNAAVKKGTYYKFIVVALDSKGKVVSTSKTVHAATTGGKVGNAKAITTKAKKNKVRIKAKKSFKLKAKAKPASKKLKVKKHRGILYESSNTKVATVNGKGVIKGVGKGSCIVYVYAQNGVCKQIKVTVK